MNREQFMKQLSYLLQDISDEDRTDALDYYENYLDEAGFGYETDITNELGSPERIAAITVSYTHLTLPTKRIV